MPNGYDFSEDDGVLEEQREAAKNAAEWANLNEKAIAAELNGLASRVRECAAAIERVFRENDCGKTRDLLRALATKDLGGGGWLAAFFSANKDTFAGIKDPARPEGYAKLSAEDKNKFEAALRYFRDVRYLLEVRAPLFLMLGNLKLVEGFRIDQLAYNLDKAGYHQDFYRKLDRDVQNIAALLNSSWYQLEEAAIRSKRFLAGNKGKLPAAELDKRYREERLADFREIVKSSGLSHFLVERSGGQAYSVDPRRLAAMSVIDKYTLEIVVLPNLIEPMQRVMDDCKKALSEAIPEAEKHCSTQAGQELCAAFRQLAENTFSFAEWCQEVYRAFQEKKEEGVYCWMKKLSALNDVKPRYEFNPSTAEPWESGTRYWNLFKNAARAVGTLGRTFAYEHGAEIV